MSLAITIEPSLEWKLESAYASILKQITQLCNVSLLLNSTQLINDPSEENDAGSDANRPIPNITLTATLGVESLLGCGVRECQLKIEATDNASREGSDGMTLDTLYTAAITPLFITNDGSGNTFEQLLSIQITGAATPRTFKCYGFANAERITASEMEKNGDLVTRSASVILICTGFND